MCGPYSGGQSHQRQPLLSTCTMPLITRRSSTRSTPRTSVGKWSLIRDHCSSLSQNKFLRTISIPFKFESELYCQRAELMSSNPNLKREHLIDQVCIQEILPPE